MQRGLQWNGDKVFLPTFLDDTHDCLHLAISYNSFIIYCIKTKEMPCKIKNI